MVVERLMKKLFESPITFLESFDKKTQMGSPEPQSLVRSTDVSEAGAAVKSADYGITMEARTCREL